MEHSLEKKTYIILVDCLQYSGLPKTEELLAAERGWMHSQGGKNNLSDPSIKS